MKSKALTPQRATPSVLPSTPWRAEGTTPHIAHVLDSDQTLLGVIVCNLGPAGTALRVAERMAASIDAIRLLGALRAAVQTGSGREIDAACAAADALLGRLGEGQP